VVYYSGHGIEGPEGVSRFVGVDNADSDDVESASISITEIKRALASSGAKVKIVILDACRNPAGLTGTSITAYWGGPVDSPEGLLQLAAFYASQPGQRTSSEGPDGYSLFTYYFLRRLNEPNWSWVDLFNQVTVDLVAEVGSKRVPQQIGSLPSRASPSVLIEQVQINQLDTARPASRPIPFAQLVTDYRSNLVYWRLDETVSGNASLDKGDQWFLLALQEASTAGGVSMPKAVELLRRAAEAGSAEAGTNLGYHLATGRGVAVDPAAAEAAWTVAADRGSAAAMDSLGVQLRRLGNEDAQPMCDAPSSSSMWSKDDVAAVALFERASKLGLPAATTDLAYMKLTGRGTARDCAGARSLLRRAAAEGDPSAVGFLAVALERGWGGAKDAAEARRLYLAASDLMYPEAMAWVARDTLSTAVGQERAAALALFTKAAATGSPGAQFALASWIERFDAKRIDEALRYYRLAAQGGFKTAYGRLAQLERQLADR
jgi:TPR repeat protein